MAFRAKDSQGQRLIEQPVLNSVVVLMVVTSILGPVLTERFGRRVIQAEALPVEPAVSPSSS
jgi:hypothetical protein